MNTLFLLFRRLLPRLRFASLGGLLLTALLLTVAPPTAAQSVDLLQGGGGTGDDEGQATATDAAGNVYVTGAFQGTATIGGTQVISAGSYDIFVAKYNSAGVLQWLKRAGGSSDDYGTGIAVDASGVYVTGPFGSTANFNTPSDPASNTLSSAGNTDIFVAAYTTSGTVQWLQRAGGSGFDESNGIAVHGGDVHVTGQFRSTANFNTPSDPTTNTLVSAGSDDIFVAQYNSFGTVQWLQRAGGSNSDYGYGIAVNANGVYVTGNFEGSADFNTPSSPASNTLVSAESYDIFVAAYTPSGAVQWLRRAGSASSSEAGRGIAVDANGVYVTGEFAGTADFNTPSDLASNTLASAGFSDIFVAAYTPSGTVQWQKRAGGSGDDYGHSIAVNAGGVYVTGRFQNTADFNTPSNTASNTLTSAGFRDIFVATYTPTGTVQWQKRAGGSGDDGGLDIAVDANGVYVTGYFSGIVDFNTPSSTASNTLSSAGSHDLFLARFTLPPTLAGFAPTAATVCAGNIATFTATVGYVSGTYDFTLTDGSSPLSGTATGATFSQTLTTSGSGVQSFTLTIGANATTVAASTTLNVGTHPDYQALVDLYNSTTGLGWINRTGWLNGCNPCTGNGGNPWSAVTCTAGRVTRIFLGNNGLSGSIPGSLSALSRLEYLWLDNNQLTGSIPGSLSALTRLQNLRLNNNQLTGGIPSGLASLTSLQELWLSHNGLTGSVPDNLSSLTSLVTFYLDNNGLTGSIPGSLSALTTNLAAIWLNNNQLSGSIPNSLSTLTNLFTLYLQNNLLTGSIPASLSALTGLQNLLLDNNQLSGCYPASLTAFCGRTTSFSANTALPGGGSAASFSALCSSGAGSDAFVAIASASQTTALVGSAFSLSVNGGSTASFSWLAPAGATLGTPTTTSTIAATITTAGVKTFTVTVGFGSTCSRTAMVSVTGVPTCVSSFTVDDLGEGADASPGDGICATLGGVCTLRAAMQEVTALNCPGPYTITVGVSGTINLTSVLPDIVDDVTFLGPGAANLTVRRSSGGNYRIFTIPNSNSVSFSGFALTDGRSNADGGGISNRGNLTLTNCVVRNNASTGGNGGGIYNTGQLALINTSVSSNTALWGGGLHSNGGSSTLTSCSLVMNRGLWGGGINNRDHTATLTNCVLQSNTSTTGIGGGGGIVSLRGSSTLTSCSLIANRSGDGGGGIFNDSHTTILSNCLFQSNTALYGGGGISNSGGSSTLTSCSLIANQNGTSGGGFSGVNHTARISNSLFQSNTATNNEGGGIVNSGGSSTLTSCSLIANRSGDGGGGISTNNHAVILSNCLVQNNTARYGGGGISNTGGSSTLTSCSFMANLGNVGGGFYSRDNHTTSISNSLFQSNTTTFGGGGILNSGGSSTLASCSLVANQSGDNGGGINNSGSHTATLTNSLIQSNTATGLGGGVYNSGGSSRLTSCSLVANQSGASGGGIGNDNSHMTTLTNCVLQSNTATNVGGGIICFGGSTTLLNGSFENNGAGSQGGAVQIGSGNHVLTNVSFRGNSAPTGTVFFLQSGTTQLTNGVLFGNGVPGNVIRNGTLQATFSLFEQNTTGFSASPTNLTTALSPFANSTGTQLNACSPAIDAGSNAAFTALTSLSTDLSGNPRFFNGGTGTPDRIDMGAHEFQGIGGPPVSFSVLGSGTATCAQSPTITLSGSQTGVSYQLQRDGVNTGGAVAGTGSALSFGPQSLSGVYSVLATNPTSSCTALMPTSATVVSSAEVPSLSVTPTSATLTCTVASVTLTASGNATSYLWTGGATSSTLAVNAGGTYSVTATGANGCISTTSVVVSQSAGTPTAGLVASGTLTCAQTAVTLTASGGNAYAISGPGVASQNASAGTAVVNVGGLYSVTVTNTATGCSSVTTVTVQSNTAAPSVSVAPTSGTLTCAVTSLTLTATSSATALRWTGGSTGATLPVSASGTYSVTATGANGCSAVSNAVTITQDVAAPTLSVTPTSGTLSCAAPSLTLTATTSGTGVRWNTNETTPSIVVSTSGIYSVTATAANGCTSTTNVTVNTDLGGSSPVPTLSASASMVCAGANVIVVATVGGSPAGLQWYKDGQAVAGQTSATLALGGVQVAQAGSYVLVVAGVCSVTSTPFTLAVNPLPTVTLSFPTGTTVIGPGTGTATATITLPDPLPGGFDLSFGALGAVRYERVMIIDRINGYEIRSVDSSTGRFPITRPGPFTITATDSNGCRNRVQGVITNLPAVGR